VEADKLAKCATAVIPYYLWVPLGSVGLLLAVAGLFYWFGPVWTIWLYHLQPLTTASGLRQEDADLLGAYLQNLRTKICGDNPAQPRTFPAFLWNLGDRDNQPNGECFGRWGRYYVVLNRGWMQQFLEGRDLAFLRVLVLHEIAHVQNRDVDIWQGTEALRLAALLILTPLWLGQLFLGPRNMGLWVSGVLAMLVCVTWLALRRVRECEADVRAAASPADRDALLRVLADAPDEAAGSVADHAERPDRHAYAHRIWRSLWQRMGSLLRMHPAADVRRSIVQHPHPLFYLGFWEAVGLGIATTIVAVEVVLFFSFLLIMVLAQPMSIVRVFSFELWKIMLRMGLMLSVGLSLIVLPIVALSRGVWRQVLARAVERRTGNTMEAPGGSCTSNLRLIPFPRKPGKMPPVSHHVKGVRHDSTPLFLPDGRLGIPLDIFHVAYCLAQSMPCNPAETTGAHPATAHTLQRAEIVWRSHPQAPVCHV
jgi:Zn-dependent protease with chaperone function